jgi:hypothetical protein
MSSFRAVAAGGLVAALLLGACSSNPADRPPPTIEVARPADSPPPAAAPAGEVVPLAAGAAAALFDAATSALAVLTPGNPATVTLLAGSGPPRTLTLPGPATALAGDGAGTAWAAGRGGFFVVDLRAGAATRVEVATGAGTGADTDFTAVARRADGRLVLGSAEGTVYTLAPDLTVAARAGGFARIDALVTVGDTAVALDRGQTSVTALDAAGARRQSLRAGLGATGIAADPAGRVLVTDTRGGQLLVFGVDPLIARQAFPVAGSPYGVAGSSRWAWVSQTAENAVIGYDLSTGIPVEKVRYSTVRQPDTLAFDDADGTLFVVSATGAGVQVIRDAGPAR